MCMCRGKDKNGCDSSRNKASFPLSLIFRVFEFPTHSPTHLLSLSSTHLFSLYLYYTSTTNFLPLSYTHSHTHSFSPPSYTSLLFLYHLVSLSFTLSFSFSYSLFSLSLLCLLCLFSLTSSLEAVQTSEWRCFRRQTYEGGHLLRPLSCPRQLFPMTIGKIEKSENTNMKERLEGKIVGEGKPIRIHIFVFPRIFAQSLSID